MISGIAEYSPPTGLVVLASILVVAVPAFGQDSGGQLVHPFAFGDAGGDPAIPGTDVYDLRIPMGFTLIKPDDEKWGLRLRLVAYAGIYDFTIEEAVDLDLRFQSFAATPVWSVGMRTIVTWPVKNFHLSFGTKVQYLSTFTSDIAFDDDYGEIRLGFDARHPLPFTIGGNQGDISGYYIRRQYVDAFIERDKGDPLEIRHTNEVGFTFGTTPKVKLWFFRLPRIGLGYRWGPNVRGVRLNFGFPF
jgi:hypothetical protein